MAPSPTTTTQSGRKPNTGGGPVWAGKCGGGFGGGGRTCDGERMKINEMRKCVCPHHRHAQRGSFEQQVNAKAKAGGGETPGRVSAFEGGGQIKTVPQLSPLGCNQTVLRRSVTRKNETGKRNKPLYRKKGPRT